MSPRYISVTDTAKLIRKQLAIRFPRVKFSVVSSKYAGGASITVKWQDGPTAAQVEAITGAYAGGGFDGMIDMAYSKYAYLLPDGSATFAKTRGTAGSGGTVEAEQDLQPSFKAELVHFMADYVFCSREYSEAFYRRAFSRTCERFGLDPAGFKIVAGDGRAPHLDRGSDRQLPDHNCYVSDLIYRELRRRAVATCS